MHQQTTVSHRFERTRQECDRCALDPPPAARQTISVGPFLSDSFIFKVNFAIRRVSIPKISLIQLKLIISSHFNFQQLLKFAALPNVDEIIVYHPSARFHSKKEASDWLSALWRRMTINILLEPSARYWGRLPSVFPQIRCRPLKIHSGSNPCVRLLLAAVHWRRINTLARACCSFGLPMKQRCHLLKKKR
jgi:hypothetical protein